jgi:hemolysin activation/secretion protein
MFHLRGLFFSTLFYTAVAFCESKEIISDLKGIFVSSEDGVPSYGQTRHLEGVEVERSLELPGETELLLKKLEPYIGKPLTEEGLSHIKETISTFYSEHHHPIVFVLVPPQDVSTGHLRLVVIESKLGEIQVRDNRWTSKKYLLRNLDLKKGSAIDSEELKENMAWINRDPFRQTNVVFKPGHNPRTTDVDVVVHDRFPFQPYVGADNTGTTYTERTRLYAGFNAGSITSWNHKASYQFTTSPNARSFLAHTGSYAIPLPWKHQLYTYGGWSRGHGNLHQQVKNEAIAWQVSGRYQIPLKPLFGNFLQEIAIGYDFKSTNNSLLFGGLRVSQKTADTNQFMLQYTGDFKGSHSKTSLLMELYASPWKLTHDQTNTHYSAIRPYAKAHYMYGKIRLSETYTLPRDFVVKGMIAGQGTGWNLLPNEMFGLGGYDTVRGYSERAVNADNAVLASVEFVSPALHIFKKAKDQLTFLAFFDYGLGILHRPASFEKSTSWLAGTGVGLRYGIKTNLYVRADIGFPLHKAGVGLHAPQPYVGATLSY